ncbi:MAG: YicC/YloC family endoribonuclease [Deltaproteobacteria bacterium]
MIKSMTGFGRGTYSNGGKEYLVEIKAVNHRYLDTSVKTSRAYGYLEPKIRELVTKQLGRGKIDVNVWIEDYGTDGRTVLIDEGLADLYVSALEKLKERYNVNDNISLVLLSRFPDILKVKKDEDDEEAVWADLQQALKGAVDSLVEMRYKEGNQLKNDIIEKTITIESNIKYIEARAPLVVEEYRTKINNRIKDLLGDNQVDASRLEQEIAFFADRCSVDEEITRLRSHVKQLRQTLETDQGIGRKLDFLVQEMNREINTIGSKANDLEITKYVVEVKSEIEKVREQIQNIE